MNTIHAVHPLVGTWVEEENPVHTTTVVYTIAIEADCFQVSGTDEYDAEILRISDVAWDGEVLRFRSLFFPTKHEADHEFRLRPDGRAEHVVSYSDEDGECIEVQLWKKRPWSSSFKEG